MPSIAVLNQVGEKVKEINLSEAVFAVESQANIFICYVSFLK